MTTLKNLKGTAIQFLDADPVVYAGTWSSGGSVNTARQYGAGIGSSTAGLIFGGSSPPVVANTEQYNGTAWTEVNDLNAAQNAQASAGTLTSGMSALGAQSPGANVEDWNGTVWTANPHSLNSARQFPGGDGASNDSALMVGGEPAPNGALTEIYNGSSWTESGDLNTARNQLAAAGTVTALIAMGGNTGADAETFNGSAWTAVTDMNSGSGGISGSGTSTLALAFAGNPDVANTESWNGSAWTEVNDLSTGREFGASSNITGNTTAFLASGYTTTLVSNTEEWAFPEITASIVQEGDMWFNSTSSTLKAYGTAAGIPATSWSSGGNLNTGRRGGGGAGVSNTAALVWGGENIPPPTAQFTNTESYNGTAWTELNDLNTKNADQSFSGTQTAAIGGGGANPDPNTLTESWNGSTWTEVADLNAARYNGGSIGFTASAHNFVGGLAAPVDQNNEFWNGTSWTEQNNLNTGRFNMFGFGNPASGLVGGGLEPSLSGKVESWDGTSWTETTDLNTARVACRGTGNTSSGIVFGGGTPSATGKTEFWNGSSWTEINDMSSGRATIMPNRSGGAVSAIAAGGPSSSALTEEWTTDNTLSTVTTS